MKNICCTKPTNRHKNPQKAKENNIVDSLDLFKYETVSVITRKSGNI